MRHTIRPKKHQKTIFFQIDIYSCGMNWESIFFLNESLSIELQFAHKHLYVVRGTFSQKFF
jgi:hypothetical protein